MKTSGITNEANVSIKRNWIILKTRIRDFEKEAQKSSRDTHTQSERMKHKISNGEWFFVTHQQQTEHTEQRENIMLETDLNRRNFQGTVLFRSLFNSILHCKNIICAERKEKAKMKTRAATKKNTKHKNKSECQISYKMALKKNNESARIRICFTETHWTNKCNKERCKRKMWHTHTLGKANGLRIGIFFGVFHLNKPTESRGG